MQAVNHNYTKEMQAKQSTILCDWLEGMEDMDGELSKYCGLSLMSTLRIEYQTGCTLIGRYPYGSLT